MDEVVILKTGVPAKLTNSFSSKTFSVEGFLTSFSFNLKGEEIKYKYFDADDFKEQDKKVAGVGQCYLSEKKYLDYIENETLTISPYDAVKELLKNQFSFSNYLAKPKVRDVAGDVVTVNVVEFDDYDFYFKMSRYTFEVEGQSNSILPKNYLRFTSLGFELDIPDTATKEDISRDLNETPRGKFYALNFGSHVGNWSEDIDNTQKRNHAKIITYCCFRINRIVKDLFVKLDDAESLSVIDALAYYENNTERQDAYNSLSDYEKLLFQLKRSWGYYADSTNTGIEGIDGFTAVLPNTPDIDAYIAYYSALTNFYNVVYRLQNTFLNLSDNEKFKYLISILPSTSLNLVPFSLRLELLKDFLDFEFERENVPFSFGSANGVAIVSPLYMQSFLKVGPTEETALQIIFSISESEADDFLDFLLQKPDGKHTYFEKFYDTIDDSSLYRRPVLGWFVDEQPNRKYFIFKIYELWKESKYALGHYELNADSEIEFILNTNSFFYEGGEGESYLFDKDEYDTEGFLESIGKKTFLENQFKRTENQGGLSKREHSVTFNPVKELQGVNMFIEKITKDTVISSYYPVGRLVSVNEIKEPLGTYHLYQPIKLGGYVADPDFEGKYFVPQNTQIPAFLFYYVDDYDEIKDFDANVSLAIEITAEVALFFITGGATSIRYLGHLRYFKNATRVGRFFNKTSLEGLAQGTKMSFWKGVEGAAEGFTLSASVVLANIQNMEATANDAKEIDYYRNLSYVFMALTLFGAGASVGARRMAVKGADDTLKEISRLANEENIFIEPNQEIIDMLNTLKGTRTVSLSSFSSRLATISDEAGNKNLVAIFESFLGSGDDVSKQYALFNEFTGKGDDFWKTLNRNGGELLQEWGKMYDLNIPERQIVEVITNSKRTTTYLKFYEYSGISTQLRALTDANSIRFVDDFSSKIGDIDWLTRLNEKPEAVIRWNNLTERGKILVKNNPEEWLYVYDNPYILRTKGEKIPDTEIVALFEQRGLNLVNDVEAEALFYYNNLSGNQRRSKVLVAGGKDLDGKTILKTNFSKDELINFDVEKGKIKYQDYLDTMHPNLKRRVDKIKEFSDFDAGRPNYHVDNSVTYPNGNNYDVNQAGNFPGAHAEVQVVNDLATAKWGNIEVSEEVFSNWLKNDVLIYNRNISVKSTETKVIMHTCIDCANILPEVTFINKFF